MCFCSNFCAGTHTRTSSHTHLYTHTHNHTHTTHAYTHTHTHTRTHAYIQICCALYWMHSSLVCAFLYSHIVYCTGFFDYVKIVLEGGIVITFVLSLLSPMQCMYLVLTRCIPAIKIVSQTVSPRFVAFMSVCYSRVRIRMGCCWGVQVVRDVFVFVCGWLSVRQKTLISSDWLDVMYPESAWCHSA